MFVWLDAVWMLLSMALPITPDVWLQNARCSLFCLNLEQLGYFAQELLMPITKTCTSLLRVDDMACKECDWVWYWCLLETYCSEGKKLH